MPAVLALVLVAVTVAAAVVLLARRDRRRSDGRRALLEAIEGAARGAASAANLHDMAEAVLRPLTRAFSPADGLLGVWTLDPPREGRLEGRGRVVLRPVDLPASLAAWIRRGEGVVRVADLETRAVRDPALRDPALLLATAGVALVVTAVADGEAQGAWLLPAPLGEVPLDDRAIRAFEEAAPWVAPAVAHAAAQARFDAREAEWHAERLARRVQLDRERARAREATSPTRPTFVARSPAMQNLLQEVDRVAESPDPILLEAEAGAGAGRIARALHAGSAWSEGPFVERDARRLRAADLRPDGVAAGGTLLVRDVVAVPETIVEPLLQAILSASLRVIATTRVDLLPLASEGRFDLRLWEAIRRARLRVPSLAERLQDLAELATSRLRDQALALGRPDLYLSAGAQDALARHAWPGNVPELDLVLADAASRARGPRVEAADLRLPTVLPPEHRAAKSN